MTTRAARRLTGLTLAVALLVAAAPPLSAPVADVASAHIDPRLFNDLEAGAALGILSWDDAAASRADVTGYLDRHGVSYRPMTVLPMAIVCATGPRDAITVAGAPGALSVWSDEKLTPTSNGQSTAASGARGSASVDTMGFTGSGVGIAVLDTGVDGTHPDLAYGPRTVMNTQVIISHYEIFGPGNDTCVPNVYREELEDSETVSGHGTHLAGVAAGDGTASDGAYAGIAPDADIVGMSVVEQATPQNDEEIRLSLVRLVAGVDHVLRNTVWDGGPPTTTKVAILGWTVDSLYHPYGPHALALRDMHEYGVTAVIPAGNEGAGGQSRCDVVDTCHFNGLGASPFAIVVGATTGANPPSLEAYSSRGDPFVREGDFERFIYRPTLVAPGTDVVAARRDGLVMLSPDLDTLYPLAGQGDPLGHDPTDLDYQALTGTSVAVAHVAGVAALVQQAARDTHGCYLHPDHLRDILTQTARPMPASEWWEVGAGEIDATAAIEAVLALEGVPGGINPWECPGT